MRTVPDLVPDLDPGSGPGPGPGPGSGLGPSPGPEPNPALDTNPGAYPGPGLGTDAEAAAEPETEAEPGRNHGRQAKGQYGYDSWLDITSKKPKAEESAAAADPYGSSGIMDMMKQMHGRMSTWGRSGAPGVELVAAQADLGRS